MLNIEASLNQHYDLLSSTIANASLIADALGISLDQLAGRKAPVSYFSPNTAMFLRENAENPDELTDEEHAFIRDVILAMKRHLQ